MPLYSSEAIVLRKNDYQEADRIITFLTRDRGKLSGMARGAKRIRSRCGPSLEVLTHGKLIYFDREGKNLVSINQFDVLHSFQEVRENLIRSVSCQYICELVMGLIPEKEDVPDVFRLFLESLQGIAASEDTDAVLRIFEIRFIELLGFAPRMDACVRCGKEAQAYGFSMKEGGLVCPVCKGRSSDVRTISQGALFFWRQASAFHMEKVDRIRLQGQLNSELKRLLYRYLLHLLGREIRSYTFLEQVKKLQRS